MTTASVLLIIVADILHSLTNFSFKILKKRIYFSFSFEGAEFIKTEEHEDEAELRHIMPSF